MQSVNSYIIQFGTGLWLLFSLLEWLKGRRFSHFFWLGIVMFSMQLRLGLLPVIPTERYMSVSWLTFSSIYMIGPLVHSLTYSMLRFVDEYKKPGWYHYLPAGLLAAGETVLLFMPDRIRSEMAVGFVAGEVLHPLNLLSLGSTLIIPAYFMHTTMLVRKISRRWEIDYDYRTIYLLLLMPMGFHVLIHTGFQLSIPLLYHVGCDGLTVMAVTILLVYVRHPDFFHLLRSEVKEKKYAKSILDGIRVEVVKERLEDLMQNEHLYRDDELRLNSLAARVLITPHQLSKLLNDEYKMRFNDFVNSYRIEEARHLLLEDRGKTILRIAFDVGFSSKSTFNAQFARVVGQSPSEYRSGSERPKD